MATLARRRSHRRRNPAASGTRYVPVPQRRHDAGFRAYRAPQPLDGLRDAVRGYPVTFVTATGLFGALVGYWIGGMSRTPPTTG